jgi:N-acyl homoserine lactone hydrolase
MPAFDIRVISTGEVSIRPEHVRSNGTPMLWWLLTSRTWTSPRPINVYVIDHPSGLVLFDTGQDRASITDSHYFPAGIVGWFYRRLARFSIGTDDTLSAQLAGLGYAASDVTHAVISHLHQDHIGGLSELTSATIVVTADEWSGVSSPLAELDGIMSSHIDLPGLRWDRFEWSPTDDESVSPFDRARDLFGDGSLVLLPTPGHTPGSLSLLVRRDDAPPILLVGDLTYDVALLDTELLPGVGKRGPMLDSTRKVLELRRRMPDLVILAAHDPGAATALSAMAARA